MENNKMIQQYKINNKLNIEQIVSDYTPYIFKTAKNICGSILSQEDIEELLYETFLVLWLNTDKLQEDKPLSPYLVGILKNLIKKKYRNIHETLNIENYDNIIISYNDLTAEIEEKEVNKILSEELNKLSEKDRKIFELFYYSNKHTKEIAKILNTKDLIVRSRLHRIRKTLCKRLEVNGYGREL